MIEISGRGRQAGPLKESLGSHHIGEISLYAAHSSSFIIAPNIIR
jgi:hypothetical protein